MRMKRLQIKAENVTDQGIFTGHASVFGVVDLDNDVVEPGAFAESIATGTAAAGVLIFGQHDDRKEPLGRSMELREDATGLFVKGQISDTAMGRDYRQLIKDGVLDQMSIGYVAQISTHAPLAGRDSKSVQITMHIFAITDKFQMLLHRMPPVRAFCSFLMQENHADFGCEPPK